MSPFKLAIIKLRKNRLAMLSFWVLFVLYFCAIFADIISPYPYDYETREKSYHPPVLPKFYDEQGFSIRPFVYNYNVKFTQTGEKKYILDKTKRYYIYFLCKGEEYNFLGIPKLKLNLHLFGVKEPAKIFLFGSDWNGRCIFSRILYGARISLSVGLLAVFISFVIGMIIGGISGYFGGIIDTIIMRILEIIMCFPDFYLLLALRAVFPLALPSTTVYLLIILIMSLIGWAGIARIIRGIALSLRETEYVLSAKASGASSFRIIIKHILPNTLSYSIVAATLSIPGYILGESALSLLGLGINEPQASWGNMLTRAMNLTDMIQNPWILTPGFFIFITVMAFNIFGDGLRDAFDPKAS